MSEQYVVTNPDTPVPASIYQDVVILGADGQPLRDEQNRIKLRRHVTYGYESLPLSGGTMKGSLYLKGNPTGAKEAVPKDYLEDYVGTKLSEHFPTGAIFPYAAPVVPDGGLWCNSSLLNRTEQATLFGAIGETWGEGDGSTTFPLPESRDRTLWGASSTSDVGTYTEDGLPNVQGSITTYTGIDTQFYTESVDAVTFQGALKNTEGTYNCYAVAGATTSTIPVPKDLTFNAAWSNSLYSDSSKVQPRSAYALMIIKN